MARRRWAIELISKVKLLAPVSFAFFEMMYKSEPTELNRWYIALEYND